MSSRVTMLSVKRELLGNTQRNLERVAKYQEQLSSGKRINRLSDDPTAARRALVSRIQQFEGGKYLDNIDKSLGFLEATDSAMGEMGHVYGQVKELAVQGANGSQDASSRRALATSVDALLDRLVDLTNTIHDGRYIFAGTATLDKPFRLDEERSSAIYGGNLDTFSVEIGPSTTTDINKQGYELWKESVDVFTVLVDVRDALLDNDPDQVTGLIDQVDMAADHINALHGEVGGRSQRLELARSQLEDAQLQLGELISREEDVDMAETIMNMQNAQVALESSLQVGARVIQPSLLDFL